MASRPRTFPAAARRPLRRLDDLHAEVAERLFSFLNSEALASLETASAVWCSRILEVRCWERFVAPRGGAFCLLQPQPDHASFGTPVCAQRYWKSFLAAMASGNSTAAAGKRTEVATTAAAIPRPASPSTAEATPDKPRPAMRNTSAGRIYAFGGQDEPDEEDERATGAVRSLADVGGEGDSGIGSGGLSWRRETPLAVPRTCAAAAVDRFGCGLIVGGWDGARPLAAVERCRRRRRRRHPLAAMDAASAATGAPPALAALELVWEQLPPLREARCFPAAAFDTAGRAYALGGGGGPLVGASVMASIEVLARDDAHGLGSCSSSGRRACSSGGACCGSLAGDDASLAWRPGPPMLEPRCGLAAAVCPASGLIYAVGGFGGGRNYLSSAEVLNPATERWTPAPSMAHRRTGFGLAWGPDGGLYAAGGSPNGSSALTALERLDPREGRWQGRAPSLLARAYCAAAFATSGQLYLLGGGSLGTGLLKSIEVYCPRADRWRLLFNGLPGVEAADEAQAADGGVAAATDILTTEEREAAPAAAGSPLGEANSQTGVLGDMSVAFLWGCE
ncbi:unnamed protein product [Phaeothamnion confervicola]